MLLKRGIPVSHGVVTGPAFVLGAEGFRIPQRFILADTIDSEVKRFRHALKIVCEEISANEKLATERLGKQYSAIFAAHLQMIQDPKIHQEIEELVRSKCFSPEYASSRVLKRYAQMFQSLGNDYFAERAADVHDLEKRLLSQLLGERKEELAALTEPVVVLAHNLTPSETANLNTEFVLGFATEAGGSASHTAILAGAIGIPAVVGVGPFLSDLTGKETVIINGTRGEIIIGPDEATLEGSRKSQQQFKSYIQKLESLKTQKGCTKDGVSIRLMGNIEFPGEVSHARSLGAEGIGLYRTEFLYMDADQEPSEDEHYQAYRQVIQEFPHDPVIIRTLDLGSDKMPATFKPYGSDESDPNLGLRSIRVSLHHLEPFKTQLRAILRAAVDGDVRIMFPLITALYELRQAKAILRDVQEDLEEQGEPFHPNISVGMMVEVPSAALMSAEFAREVNFFSIGTNDLIQYALACDRSDPNVAHLYKASDPAILRLLHMVLQSAKAEDIPVSVCGRMSSDPLYAPLLVGMGLRQLSVSPHSIGEVKEVLRHLTIPKAEEIVEYVKTLDLARDIDNYLRGELHQLCPDMVVY